MTDWGLHALSIATALACGLLIGIERGFDLRGLRAGTRVAGVRTFTLLGLASGLAGLAGHLRLPAEDGVSRGAVFAHSAAGRGLPARRLP